MKKVTMNLDGVLTLDSAEKLNESLNNLSGIVAADISLSENKAYVYAGDQLTKQTITDTLGSAGHHVTIEREEYM